MLALLASPAAFTSLFCGWCGLTPFSAWSTCWLVVALEALEPCLSLALVEWGLSGLSVCCCWAHADPAASRAARQSERMKAVMWLPPVQSARKLATRSGDRTLPALLYLHERRASDYVARVPDGEVILETRGLSKEFRGFIAVKRVDLRVMRGTIHALIGPNGAGKTTCFNLLTRFLPATSGVIKYKGEDITPASPADVARKGLVRSFQISAVFPYLTALENVRIALQRKRGSSFDFWRSNRVLREFDARGRELLAAVGLQDFRDTLAAELS